ncbi:MAG: hypothetical protein EPO16_06950 [Dehalococcoidia bacterium]|nr:MAG: hypothetical protein EPO16_06950 [Dehalococcoidia bacterium]
MLDRASGAAFKVWSRPTETLAVPRGIVIERNGLGLIADANDHTLSAWDLRSDGDGRAYQFGAPGMQDDQFLFPNDVVIDRTGRIYVADRDNGRVQVWR